MCLSQVLALVRQERATTAAEFSVISWRNIIVGYNTGELQAISAVLMIFYIFIFYYYEVRSVSTGNRFYSVFDSCKYWRTTINNSIHLINSGRRK